MNGTVETNAAMRALTMRLDDETFAIDAESVREILEVVPITRVPSASDAVFGLINVRGSVVPLADFRVLFNMDRRPATEDTRIVVVEVQQNGERLIAGVLADKVYEVVDLEGSSREPVPRVGMRWPAELVLGIARRNDTFVIIPNVQNIFATLAAA
ncbi:chemotaxis protein CheW [Aquibium sp. ELW1220]|uniref:chemotaxis protein CheW n=1 Tax=Aquibium sp. ELW1220 TaxID=2976766 RepID=UPI0025B183E6|nr:chemotaxis protein CheW [Aquibium sp. ELW1220]MDN2581023.1 chemotaxis protein CheW [Aquibium sp. ELW1220]